MPKCPNASVMCKQAKNNANPSNPCKLDEAHLAFAVNRPCVRATVQGLAIGQGSVG